MTPFLPELTADGVVLWRVRRSPEQQLWCTVHDFAGEFSLSLQDPSTPTTSFTESHADIGALIDRADQLRDQLERGGWHVVDIDLDEPD